MRHLLVFLLCISAAYADFQTEFYPRVLEIAKTIKPNGILKQKENGYLYLEISPDFLTTLIPLIDVPGKIVPRPQFPHISVMYENEVIINDIWEIEEIGKEFTFSLISLRTIKVHHNNKVRKLWLIAVSCPELEELRTRYGLSPRLKNHDFHITLGTQVPAIPQAA